MKETNEWMSISDMMAGLMIIFLFIAVVYIHDSLKETEDVGKAVKDYRECTKFSIKSLVRI